MRVLLWIYGLFVVAALILYVATAPPPPPQRFDLGAGTPLSAYWIQPYHTPEDDPGMMVCENPPRIELHLARGAISIFVSQLDIPPLFARRGKTQEERVATRLRALHHHGAFDGRTDIRIVVHDGVAYRDVIRAFELADRAGFDSIAYFPPEKAIFSPPAPLAF